MERERQVTINCPAYPDVIQRITRLESALLTAEESDKITIQKIDELHKQLLGDGGVGFYEQVRLNTRFRKNANKLVWLFISGVIINVTAIVIASMIVM